MMGFEKILTALIRSDPERKLRGLTSPELLALRELLDELAGADGPEAMSYAQVLRGCLTTEEARRWRKEQAEKALAAAEQRIEE